jgi:hypothetical protein
MFLLLSGGGNPEGRGFGTLDLPDGETLRHDGVPMAGLPELVQSCLQRFRT